MQVFTKQDEISEVALNILNKRYFHKGETTWDSLVNRVVDHILGDCKDDEQVYLTKEMMINRYFIPNSPTLVNSGKPGGGLVACFVVDFKDSIEEIYKTKLDFALIAKKGGGCGTTLSKLRPEGEIVNGSSHGYAGGPVKFFDTICHDMEVITQSGFREMAMMG
jgi:ribonucleoside-diphosphate reductase alpha chain